MKTNMLSESEAEKFQKVFELFREDIKPKEKNTKILLLMKKHLKNEGILLSVNEIRIQIKKLGSGYKMKSKDVGSKGSGISSSADGQISSKNLPSTSAGSSTQAELVTSTPPDSPDSLYPSTESSLKTPLKLMPSVDISNQGLRLSLPNPSMILIPTDEPAPLNLSVPPSADLEYITNLRELFQNMIPVLSEGINTAKKSLDELSIYIGNIAKLCEANRNGD